MATGQYVTTALLKERLGITDSTDDTLLGEIVDETNAWIESYTDRILAPVTSASYLFNGYDTRVGRTVLDVWRLGARSVSLLETAPVRGGTFSTVAATKYLVRPATHDRLDNAPGTSIQLTEGTFPTGYENIRVTMTAGFDSIPEDVRAVAIAIAQRWWHGRQTGMVDVVGMDESALSPGSYQQAPILVKTVPPEFRRTLDRYKRPLVR